VGQEMIVFLAVFHVVAGLGPEFLVEIDAVAVV
jgi:hypothetical protein